MHRRPDGAAPLRVLDSPFGRILAVVAAFPEHGHDLHVQEGRCTDLTFKVWNSVLRMIKGAHESKLHLCHVINGYAGAAVESLQSMLQLYGYGININGVFDAMTKTVVAAFQLHFRRAQVDGIADRETQARLNALVEGASV